VGLEEMIATVDQEEMIGTDRRAGSGDARKSEEMP
jgi:hypothetical protein